ncbi:MAG: toll/interleukin-1 receptor domain-containing protein [Chloroflexi bacterium]|nr:toll/interleukin-1 receptor domain-containing protein [Chloroflexota bacterium]
MNENSTFVSFTEADRYFVDLLVEVLRFHGVRVWCSNTSLTAGDQWRATIHEAIKSADSLTAVVSKNTINSDWVKREVAVFLATKPNAPVIPLSLDGTPLSLVDSDLERFQAAKLEVSMLEGFRTLLAALGRKFLSEDSIVVTDRRSGRDRRSGVDRRVSPISQRVKIGFWKAFHGVTGSGKFDEVGSLGEFLHGAIGAIKPEADKYVYQDTSGQRVPSSQVLDKASMHVFDMFWQKQAGNISGLKMIYIIEALAKFVSSNYEVTVIDRRRSERRSGVSALQPKISEVQEG